MIVGEVYRKSCFASTTGAISEQPIAKYINSQAIIDWMPERKVYRFRIDPTVKQKAYPFLSFRRPILSVIVAMTGGASLLPAPPDVPGDWPGFIVRRRAARRFEGKLYLTVMVSLVEDQELN